MPKVKIYGAGSIGNHLANASRRLGWAVTVCDVSQAALDRMKNDIYPTRYGSWDASIQLYTNDKAPRGGFDWIFIGTPPDYHIPLALDALKESPKGLLIEKPLCSPSLSQAQELADQAARSNTKVFVGYTHVAGRATQRAEALIASGVIGKVLSLDSEFREHWEGIFKAHSWLSGPEDSYLGYWAKGGGASGEHSHAINLWQHWAHALGFGRVTDVNADLRYVTQGKATYDDLCFIDLRTEKGLLGRVVQDVVTRPSRKRVRIQGSDGTLEWVANYNSEGDAILINQPGQAERVEVIAKTRPDDFIEELKHVDAYLTSGEASPLSLERGLDTMLVLAAAHRSEKEGKRISLNSVAGYTPRLLTATTR